MQIHKRLLISVTRRALIAMLLALVVPTLGRCQLNLSPNVSLSTSVIVQGGCYTMRIPNWSGALLNLGYTTAWTGQQYVFGFPSLDLAGNAVLCSTSGTHTGTYTYDSVSNTNYYQWWTINSSVTITTTPPTQQPTALSFSSPGGYAGLDCYTMNVANANNKVVDFYYAISAAFQPIWSATIDGSGQWRYCLNHHDQVGEYTFYQMKNHAFSDWVILDPPVTYSVKPPQPLYFITSPDGIVQGGWYQMSVGNGAAVTMDLQYALNDGPTQTILGWPTLAPGDGNYGYGGSSQGYVNIWTGPGTALGKYVFIAIRNTLNTEWVPVAASIAVCPIAGPSTLSIIPSTVPQSGSTDLTITGTNLCSPTVQNTTPNGLSFSNIRWNAPFSSITVTATASSSTPIGPTQIRITTPAGSVTSSFGISAPPSLTKEHIYLGDRVISTITP